MMLLLKTHGFCWQFVGFHEVLIKSQEKHPPEQKPEKISCDYRYKLGFGRNFNHLHGDCVCVCVSTTKNTTSICHHPIAFIIRHDNGTTHCPDFFFEVGELYIIPRHPPPHPHPMVMGLYSSAPVPPPPLWCGWWWVVVVEEVVYVCICMYLYMII